MRLMGFLLSLYLIISIYCPVGAVQAQQDRVEVQAQTQARTQAQAQAQPQSQSQSQAQAQAQAQSALPRPQALSASTKAQGQAAKSRESGVVMVIIDRLSLAELYDQSLPHFRQLLRLGAVGLMNTNVPGARTPDNTYATIGSGARITTGQLGGEGFNSAEIYPVQSRTNQFISTGKKLPESQSAATVYRRRMGISPANSSVLHLQVPRILAFNANQKYLNCPGAIGRSLHAAGLRTGVLGNADTDFPPHGRQVVTIAMDQWGRVDYGRVDQGILKPDNLAVWGFVTNYPALWREYQVLKNKADFLVIDLGDLARADSATNYVLTSVINAERKKALVQADAFLGQLLSDLDLSRQLLMVITPTPSAAAIEARLLLTPVVLAGPGIKAGGLLSTPTTKRMGLLTNIDIAPTVLRRLGVTTPVDMLGQVISTGGPPAPLAAGGVAPAQSPGSAAAASEAFLLRMEQRANLVFIARPTLVQGYVFLEIVGILLALGTVFLGWPSPGFMKKLLLGVMAVPLSLLILPLFPVASVSTAVGLTILLTILVVSTAGLAARRRHLDAFIFICLGTVAAILSDVIFGSPLLKESVLSYDPMVGARYYGIGNEYMGVLLGAATVGTAALVERCPNWRKPLLWGIGLFYLLTTYILAAPNLGTEAGGTVAAIVGFGFTYLWLWGVRPGFRAVMGILLLTGAALGGMMAYDLSRTTEAQSHIGRATSLIAQNGFPEMLKIIQRKVAVNLKLIVNVTIWARVLLVSMFVLGVFFYRPVGVMHILREKYRFLYNGLVGVVIGSLIAFIFNDSGIVAAATMMVFCTAPLIYLLIQEIGTPAKPTDKASNGSN